LSTEAFLQARGYLVVVVPPSHPIQGKSFLLEAAFRPKFGMRDIIAFF
jgi:hypothetical protein